MAKKKRKVKTARKKTSRGARKGSRTTARRKASASKRAKRTPRKAAGRVTSRRATKKRGSTEAARPRKAAVPPGEAVSSGLSVFPPAGEVYGEESWKEEELSAAELDVDAPELDELESEIEAPEVGEESEDSEW